MNNSSTEGVVRSGALAREKEEMAKKVSTLEAELAAAKKAASEKDKKLAFLEKKADSAARLYNELKEVHAKFAAEKKGLEDASEMLPFQVRMRPRILLFWLVLH